jgi:GH35 family endo-1,4-beta-xylanase
LSENQETPFFLAVGFKKPHLPFSAPQKYWNLYQRDKFSLAPFQKKSANKVDIAYHSAGELQSYLEPGRSYPVTSERLLNLDENFQRELIHGYYACVSFIDFQIGKIINTLKQTGLYENTIIVVWGDHGWHLGDHSLWAKHSNFEQATRSPLIIYTPNSKKSTQVVSPTEFVDVFPTLCELAGVEEPKQLDGTSLVPLMNRTLQSVKEVAVSQYNRGKTMGYSFRSTQHRYTVWLKDGVKSTHAVKESDIIAEEFYDYKLDPLETVNLMNNSRYLNPIKNLKNNAFDFFNSQSFPEIPKRSDPVKIQKPIKEILTEKGYDSEKVYIGATLNHRHLGTEIEKMFLKDFSYSTPENCAKQSRIHPKPNVWDWSQLEDYLDFAIKNNVTLRIHGPISPQVSRWAKEDHRTHEELNTNMVEYFTALCKKINGHSAVKWMDVVNETVTPEGEWFKEKPGNTKWENPWEQLGHDEAGFPLYITKAFEIANKNAPNVSLVFNQHGGMEPKMWDRVKRTILYLKEKGYRIDGLGWQAHLKSNQKLALDKESLQYFSDLIDWAHQNDLDFHVTEIDYKIFNSFNESQSLIEQSNAYSNILKVLLSKTKTGVVTFNTWGLVDGFGKHHDSKRFIYDKQYNPKPAYYGLKNTLTNPFEPLQLYE